MRRVQNQNVWEQGENIGQLCKKVLENMNWQENKKYKLKIHKSEQRKMILQIQQLKISCDQLRKQCEILKKKIQQSSGVINQRSCQNLERENQHIQSGQSQFAQNKQPEIQEMIHETQEDEQVCKHYSNDIKKEGKKKYICFEETCIFKRVFCEHCYEEQHKKCNIQQIANIKTKLGHQSEQKNPQNVKILYRLVQKTIANINKIIKKYVQDKFQQEIQPQFEAIKQAYSNETKDKFIKLTNKYSTAKKPTKQLEDCQKTLSSDQLQEYQKIINQARILFKFFDDKQFKIQCKQKWNKIAKFQCLSFIRVINRKYHEVSKTLLQMYSQLKPFRLFKGILGQSNIQFNIQNLGLMNVPNWLKNKIFRRLKNFDYMRQILSLNYPTQNKPKRPLKQLQSLQQVQVCVLNQEFQDSLQQFLISPSHSVILPCPGKYKCRFQNQQKFIQFIYFSSSERMRRSHTKKLEEINWENIIKYITKKKKNQTVSPQQENQKNKNKKRREKTEYIRQMTEEEAKQKFEAKLQRKQDAEIKKKFEASLSLFDIMKQKRSLTCLMLQHQKISQTNQYFFYVLGQNKLLMKLHLQFCIGLSSQKLFKTIFNNGIELNYLALICPDDRNQIGGESLWKLTTLQTLILNRCNNIVREKAREGIKKMQLLKRLQISHITTRYSITGLNRKFWFDDEIMKQLLNMKFLKHLNIQRNKGIKDLTGKQLLQLIAQGKLRTIIFYGTQFCQFNIKSLTKNVLELQTDQNRMIRKPKQEQEQPKQKEEEIQQDKSQNNSEQNIQNFTFQKLTINQVNIQNIKINQQNQKYILLKTKIIGTSSTTEPHFVGLISRQLLKKNSTK